MEMSWNKDTKTGKMLVLLEIDAVDFVGARLIGLSKLSTLSHKLRIFAGIADGQENSQVLIPFREHITQLWNRFELDKERKRLRRRNRNNPVST